MNVPFLDLKVQFRQIEDEVLPMVKEAMENAAFIGGPQVSGFEAESGSGYTSFNRRLVARIEYVNFFSTFWKSITHFLNRTTFSFKSVSSASATISY
jgi:hypothetical protein